MSSLIRLENVDFFYDYKSPVEMHALKGINLEIPTGTYASFLGPSGCGKSTLLYAIAGVERPQSGKVFFNEKNLVDLSESEVAMFRQEGIGIIFQNFNLIPTLKIVDNVMLPMAFLGASLEKRRKRAMEILDKNLRFVQRFLYLAFFKIGKQFRHFFFRKQEPCATRPSSG